uniref:Uncharacterized protein n=1 Tax=Suricata suricatta TaxID=37032 RepID=A0A673SXQ1_SURSU
FTSRKKKIDTLPNTVNKICQFKLVLEEPAVGTSSLVLCFVKGHFHEFQENILDNTTVKSEVGDAAGQE